MRPLRFVSAVLVASLVFSVAPTDGPLALAQSTEDADEAKEEVDQASSLVDEAIAERDEIERELAKTITRVTTSQLSSQQSDRVSIGWRHNWVSPTSKWQASKPKSNFRPSTPT